MPDHTPTSIQQLADALWRDATGEAASDLDAAVDQVVAFIFTRILTRAEQLEAAIAAALSVQVRVRVELGLFLRLAKLVALQRSLGPKLRSELTGTALDARQRVPAETLLADVLLRERCLLPADLQEAVETQIQARVDTGSVTYLSSLLMERDVLQGTDRAALEREVRHRARMVRLARERHEKAEGSGTAYGQIIRQNAAYLRRLTELGYQAEGPDDVNERIEELSDALGERVFVWEFLLANEAISIQAHRDVISALYDADSPPSPSWRLGTLVVELGFCTPTEVLEAIRVSQPGKRRLGDELVFGGKLDPAELQYLLEVQEFRRQLQDHDQDTPLG